MWGRRFRLPTTAAASDSTKGPVPVDLALHAIEVAMLMDEKSRTSIDRAKEAALRVLLHNARGPFQGLPRTAGWGYPEPYTRDLMISALGFLATGNEELADALRRTLVALASNQTLRGHIPSLAHDPADRGASDTTPLFLFGLALYRISAGTPEFLDEAAQKYSLVVIDSPPLLSAADAAGISSLPGVSVILVVGNGARRRLVRNALRKLELIEAHVAGAVMNREGRLSAYDY